VNLADSWRSRAVSPEVEKSSYLTAATSSRISPVFILAALYLRLPSQRRCELLLLFYPLRIFCTACRALLSKILSVVMIRSSSEVTSLLLHENHMCTSLGSVIDLFIQSVCTDVRPKYCVCATNSRNHSRRRVCAFSNRGNKEHECKKKNKKRLLIRREYRTLYIGCISLNPLF